MQKKLLIYLLSKFHKLFFFLPKWILKNKIIIEHLSVEPKGTTMVSDMKGGFFLKKNPSIFSAIVWNLS